MGKRIEKYFLLTASSIIFIVIGVFIIYLNSGLDKNQLVVNGNLNMSEISEDRVIPLNGEWEFYWKRFIKSDDIENGVKPDILMNTPKVWNSYKINGKKLTGFGYGTYRIRITGVEKNKEYSLYIPTISTSYNLYINDELQVSRGNVSDNMNESNPEYRPAVVTYKPAENYFDIIIHVSNFTYSKGGMWYSLYFGSNDQIGFIKDAVLSRDMFLLGCFLILFFIYTCIYIRRRTEKINLYFTFLCIIAIIRTLLHGSYLINYFIPSITVSSIVRMDYFTLFCLPVVFSLLLAELFYEFPWGCLKTHYTILNAPLFGILRRDFGKHSQLYLPDHSLPPTKQNLQPDTSSFQTCLKKKNIKLLILFQSVITLIVIFTPLSFFTRFIFYIEIIGFVFTIILLNKTLYLVRQKEKNSFIMLISEAAIIICMIYDFLFQNSYLIYSFFELTPVGFLIMLVLQAYVLSKNFTEIIEKNEKAYNEIKISYENEQKAELKFLKSQIQPHFIHNALNTIISISRKDIYRAQDLLVEFSGYLRGCFDFKSLEDVIPIENELEFIQSYIILQQARFGDSLKVEYDIEDIHIKVPPLILEPLVENAIEHGIRNKPDRGNILIYAKKLDGLIQIGVRDDGIGIKEERIYKLISGIEQSRGIGIYNITTRLQKLYGSSLVIENMEHGGLNIYMNIPVEGRNDK